ncbi:alpha/beta hydrolase [Antarcticibacterium flavum]|uniref:Alpha/beta hydrolase n=1 Tax=Antarcticibacterium flavum TaxID=2058175 RepID=A0A5B7X734_9FLAO|nr:MULTISPECIES: alpha/beta hydrolase [Antarcticibacterium]MCM4159657.1 alpha/beta hydrolase [Antarcticibacterium sp. W02-3]QCY70900.1 alpha/beta hydrolase [Antarcticibacterium flavum]
MKKLLFLILLISFPNFGQENIEVREINLENYEYPYPIDFFEVQAQQEKLSMAYMFIKAERSNGKTITLLHGKNFNGAYWKTTIDTLTAEGYDVLVPDQIGFGKSTKPKHFQYSFQQLALNTKKLLESLNIPSTVVMGHSMGGMLATRFALMYPETTTKLILLNPIGLEDWKLKVPYQSIDEWYANELDKNYKAIKEYQQENYYDGDWNEEYAQWAKLLAGWTLNENYPLIAWNTALTYDMIFTQPVVYEFHELVIPTLLLIGTRDRTALGKNLVSQDVSASMGRYDQLGKITAEKIPAASLLELKDVGHLPHIEAFPLYISSLLEYLKN